LTLTSKDGLSTCIIQLQRLIEKYFKLLDKPRERLLSLVGEIAKLSINEIEGICINLLRFVLPGDVTPKNLWLINSLLNIFDK
jgi:integrator complex subunit 3